MQIHKVAISLVNKPLVGSLESILIAVCVRAYHTFTLPYILMALVVSCLNLEFNVVANVRVLPHEELDADWELASTDLFV